MRLETEKQKQRKEKKAKVRAIATLFSMVGVIALLALVFFINGLRTSEKNKIRDEKISELNIEIEKQNMRRSELEERQNYVQSREYIEDIAREKLGLIYPGEIVFQAED